MEKSATSRDHEAQMLQAISMGMYGRPMQNRCSLLNVAQRAAIDAAAREMSGVPAHAENLLPQEENNPGE